MGIGANRPENILPRCARRAPAAPWRQRADRPWRFLRRRSPRSLGKINAKGVFLEALETNPAQYLPRSMRKARWRVVRID